MSTMRLTMERCAEDGILRGSWTNVERILLEPLGYPGMIKVNPVRRNGRLYLSIMFVEKQTDTAPFPISIPINKAAREWDAIVKGDVVVPWEDKP